MAYELKTQKTSKSVKAFLDSVTDERKRKDSYAVAALMEEVTGEKPAMWGPSIVGFGTYHYKYASGQEGDWPILSFSPRKDSLTLYVMPGLGNYKDLLEKLGKHKTTLSCLHIKTLDDVHMPTLKALVRRTAKDVDQIVKDMKAHRLAQKSKAKAGSR
jgi:hypothetical protein